MPKVSNQILSEKQITQRNIRSWPVWTKEISRFEWFYDNKEECLILEGEITVETKDGNFDIHAGDFVTFEKGLKCIWNVLKPVRKHYNFS